MWKRRISIVCDFHLLLKATSNFSKAHETRDSLSSFYSPVVLFYYARKQDASRVFAIVWASVRPSVCLSHWCIVSKRCKLGSRSLQCGLPQNSSFSWQNCVPLGKGVSLERERQRKVPLKDVILPLLALIVWKRLQIGIYLLHIITSTGDRIFRSVNIDDLEWPWTPQRGF